jgi:hypothetical protein
VAIPALLAGLAFGSSVGRAQPAEEPQAAEAAPAPEAKKPWWKTPFSLYLYAATGAAGPDDINPSIVTTENSKFSEGTLAFDDFEAARAAIGWKLPGKKGDFRLIFNGFREDGYRFEALGLQDALGPGSTGPSTEPPRPMPWWTVSIMDGQFRSVEASPLWVNIEDDANENGIAEMSEIRFNDPTIELAFPVTDDLDSQVQYVDALYGREFGGRRYSGRWWGGMRYFVYEGNVPAVAWLGERFTDGAFLRVLNFREETSGLGPSGFLEANFNFFDRRLVAYLQGSAAFQLANLESDTGPFFTLVRPDAMSPLSPAFARLDTSRDKSTWQTGAEIGVRLRLDVGLEVELAYYIVGLLDSVLFPQSIQVPDGIEDVPGAPLDDDGEPLDVRLSAVSALYSTQDLIFEGWRFGVGFQF